MTPLATQQPAHGIATQRGMTSMLAAAEDKLAGPRFAEMLQAQRVATPVAPAEQRHAAVPQPQHAAEKTPQAHAQAQGRSQAATDAAHQERAAAERAQARREQPPRNEDAPADHESSSESSEAPAPTGTAAASARSGVEHRRAELKAPAETTDAPTAAAAADAAAPAAEVAGQDQPAAEITASPAWMAALGIVPPLAHPIALPGQLAAKDSPLECSPTSGLPDGRGKSDGVLAVVDAKADPVPHERAGQELAAAGSQDFAAMLAATPAAADRATTGPAASGAPAARELGATDGVHGPSHAAVHAPQPLSGSPSAPVVTLAAPLQSPDFAQALAAQLTTFARDGVQEATLQLNPADMGPIQVQIVVDGQHAQIDFSATHAATRQVLEDGLPGLAAALHASGLTLSGGGVFEQRQPGARDASGSGQSGRDRRERGSIAALDGAETGRPAPLPAARGLLDLYA